MKNIFKNKEIQDGFNQLGKVIENKECLNLDTTFTYYELTSELLEHDIVCPEKESWKELYSALQVGDISDKKLPEPLRTDVWQYYSEDEKRERFFNLLKIADEQKRLDIAINYLNKLQIDNFDLEFVVII